MKCPFCSHENTRVIDSRPAEENNSIRRRRVCDECGKRFTTYEKIETIPLIIIKKDNNRETYDRQKIEGGVLRACHKRPVSAQTASRFNMVRRLPLQLPPRGMYMYSLNHVPSVICQRRQNSVMVRDIYGWSKFLGIL